MQDIQSQKIVDQLTTCHFDDMIITKRTMSQYHHKQTANNTSNYSSNVPSRSSHTYIIMNYVIMQHSIIIGSDSDTNELTLHESGSQRPELLQVAVTAPTAPTSENPGSHWKVMTEPSIWLVF